MNEFLIGSIGTIILAVIVAEIKARWPLIWKSTAEVEFDRLMNVISEHIKVVTLAEDTIGVMLKEQTRWRSERDRMEDENKKNKGIMLSMQAEFERVLYSDSGIRRLVNEIVKQADAPGNYVAYVVPQKIDFAKVFTNQRISTFNQREVKLFDCIVRIGLEKNTPPELVARRITEFISDWILEQWRDQSLLRRK